MKIDKNKINKSLLSNMTDEQRRVYDFIESNVSPAHRMEATLFMGHLSYINKECSKHTYSCFGCPFYNKKNNYFEPCLFRSCYPDDWDIEQIIKNIFSNLD